MEPPSYHIINNVELSIDNYTFQLNQTHHYFKLLGFKINQINAFEFSKCNIIFKISGCIIQDIPISLLESISLLTEKDDEVYIKFPFDLLFENELWCTLNQFTYFTISISLENKTLDFPINMYYSLGNYNEIYNIGELSKKLIESNFKSILDNKRKNIFNDTCIIDFSWKMHGLIIESKDKIKNIYLYFYYENSPSDKLKISLDEFILSNFYKFYGNTLFINFEIKENNLMKIINKKFTDENLKIKMMVEINESKNIEAFVYPVFNNYFRSQSGLSVAAYDFN